MTLCKSVLDGNKQEVKAHEPVNFVEEAKTKAKEEEKATFYNEEESKFTLRNLSKKYPRNIICTIENSILKPEAAPKWETIIVKKTIKEDLIDRIITPLKNRSKEMPIGVLLYGPSGNGKSILVKALAAHFGPALVFFSLSASDFSFESAVSAVFEASTISQPCIIFVNGIDGLLGSDAINAASKKGFLDGMDYIKSKYRGRIVVVGVTACPFDLDGEVMKRFGMRVYVPLPDIEQRIEFVKRSLNKLNAEQCSKIGEITEYFSFYNLKVLCEEMKKKIKLLEFESLVEAGLKKVIVLSSAKTVEQFEEWSKANPYHNS